MITNQGLVAMRDEKGNPTGMLEHATGKVYTLSGKYTGQQLSHAGADAYPEDGDALMSQYAAGIDASRRAAALGKRVNLSDRGAGGMQVNMDLGIGDVHIPSALPNFAGGYRLAEGVADIASPVVPVTKQSDYYFIWNSANAFERVAPIVEGVRVRGDAAVADFTAQFDGVRPAANVLKV